MKNNINKLIRLDTTESRCNSGLQTGRRKVMVCGKSEFQEGTKNKEGSKYKGK